MFFSILTFADEPFGYLGAEITHPGDKTRQPAQIKIPIYRYDFEGGALLYSPDSDNLKVSLDRNTLVSFSPLPEEGLEFVKFPEEWGLMMNDESSPSGVLRGLLIKNEYSTFDGKHRFILPYHPDEEVETGLISSLSLDRSTLIVASNKAKKIQALSDNEENIGTFPFPNQSWNAMKAGPVGEHLWLVVFKDGPFNEPTFQPSLNNFQPPKPTERSYFAYLVDFKNNKSRTLTGWRSTHSYASIASTKNGTALLITEIKDVTNQRGYVDSDTTETAIWVDSDGRDKPAQKRKISLVERTYPIFATENSVIRTRNIDRKTRVVEWLENGAVVKTQVMDDDTDETRHPSFAFSHGLFFHEISPIVREKGPDVITNNSPERTTPTDYLRPVRYQISRREGPPLVIKFHHLENENALINPRFYSVIATRNYIWFVSGGDQNSKKLYVGMLPVANILSAARYE